MEMLDYKGERCTRRAFHFSAHTADGIQLFMETGDLSDLGTQESEAYGEQSGLFLPDSNVCPRGGQCFINFVKLPKLPASLNEHTSTISRLCKS
jgi:hypothetical protein